MKKNNENNLTNRIVDLCVTYQIESCNRHIDFIKLQIKYYKMQIDFLEASKPFFFQRKKLKRNRETIKELRNSIINFNKQIDDEIMIIDKLKSNMGINCNKENN